MCEGSRDQGVEIGGGGFGVVVGDTCLCLQITALFLVHKRRLRYGSLKYSSWSRGTPCNSYMFCCFELSFSTSPQILVWGTGHQPGCFLSSVYIFYLVHLHLK